jgi:hypothetical protein
MHLAIQLHLLSLPQLKRVKRYNSQVHLSLRNEGPLDALRQVKQQADANGWTPELEQEYNRINNRQYEIRKKVESKIRHLRMGAVE